MDDLNIGRLIRTTNEKCPNCGKVIQIRGIKNIVHVKQIDVEEEEHYNYCPNCKTLNIRIDKKKSKNPRRQVEIKDFTSEDRRDADKKSKRIGRRNK